MTITYLQKIIADTEAELPAPAPELEGVNAYARDTKKSYFYTDTEKIPSLGMSNVGTANGIAGLDATGKLPSAHLPTSTGGFSAWVDITGKPTTFTPSAHTHPTSEITGLDTALSGKAPASHTHLWADTTDKPTTFTPSAHTHAQSDITNLSTSLATKQPLGYVALANDTLALALATNTVVKFTVTAARTVTTTVPAAGTRCTTIILTAGTTSFVITFGTGFKSAGTLATGTVASRVFVVNWISDGVSLYEAGRTAALVA